MIEVTRNTGDCFEKLSSFISLMKDHSKGSIRFHINSSLAVQFGTPAKPSEKLSKTRGKTQLLYIVDVM